MAKRKPAVEAKPGNRFLARVQALPPRRQCAVCAAPEASNALNEILEAIVSAGRRDITLYTIQEWLTEETGREFSEVILRRHLRQHALALWDKARPGG